MTAHWSWGTAPPASSELTALPLGLLAQDLNFWCAFETDEVRGMFDWESVVVKGPLELAALLSEKFGVPPWWTQMVTVGYEQAVGKRVRLQKADGFAVSASKTLSLPAAAAFKAFSDSRTRSAWLTDDLTIRKATAPKSLRITWKDGKSHVDVNIYAKGARKSQVSLQHTKLANARTATQMKK